MKGPPFSQKRREEALEEHCMMTDLRKPASSRAAQIQIHTNNIYLQHVISNITRNAHKKDRKIYERVRTLKRNTNQKFCHGICKAHLNQIFFCNNIQQPLQEDKDKKTEGYNYGPRGFDKSLLK